MKTVPERLHWAAETYNQRNALYGSTYKIHGVVLRDMFPKGVTLNSTDDLNRFGVFNMIIGKIIRYAQNFDSGGHEDSLHDLSVYAAMLQELDEEASSDG